jgi:hypothetical protein
MYLDSTQASETNVIKKTENKYIKVEQAKGKAGLSSNNN